MAWACAPPFPSAPARSLTPADISGPPPRPQRRLAQDGGSPPPSISFETTGEDGSPLPFEVVEGSSITITLLLQSASVRAGAVSLGWAPWCAW